MIVALHVHVGKQLLPTAWSFKLDASFFPILVATGSTHVLCLSDEGELFVWGNGQKGQLGLGSGITLVDTPRIVNEEDNSEL